ncbi:single-stranded DNA-binding protein [Castellaniella sp.]|uniref:single-stranded DNA-binding protein n=1 Tax=Castellaniella sp. TaxID=1955812 RepID=UPI003A94CDFD
MWCGWRTGLHCGRQGRDPEVRYSADGAAICNASIATMTQWKDKATGEKRYSTEIVADQMQMLGGREDGPANATKAAEGRAKGRGARAAAPTAGSATLEESGIPF